jgi:hypothetical protein
MKFGEEAPHYSLFSSLMSLSPSQIKISSASCFNSLQWKLEVIRGKKSCCYPKETV